MMGELTKTSHGENNTNTQNLTNLFVEERNQHGLYIKVENIDVDACLCRVCLNQGDVPIFGLYDLSADLSMITGIEVSATDNYPKHLCASCNTQLQGAIVLKKTAQESDLILKTQQSTHIAKKHKNNMDNNELDGHLESIFKYNDDETMNNNIANVYKFTVVKGDMPDRTDEIQIRELDWLQSEVEKTENEKAKSLQIKIEKEDELPELELKKSRKELKMVPKQKCPICKRNFRELAKHMNYHKKHRKESHNAICDICGLILKGSNSFPRHRASHFLDDDSALPFKCSICPYRTRVNSDLKLHMRTHTGEKPYKCPHCPSRSFINTSNLKNHLLTHRTDFDFKCDQCQKGFRRKRDLDKHIKTIHIGIREHTCKLCNRSYGAKKSLKKHEIVAHKREKTEGGKMPLYKILESKKKLQVSNTGKES